MKATLEPKKLQTILSAAMIDGEIDPFTIKTNDKGLTAVNVTSSSNIASIIVAKADYFEKFEANGTEEIVFGKEVPDRLKWGFKKEHLDISADEDNLLISDGTDKLPVELDEKIDRKMPVPITYTKYGLIADYNLYGITRDGNDKPGDWDDEKALNGFNIYSTKAENLKFPGNVTNYKLVLEDGKISVSIGGTSTSFVHEVEGELVNGENIEIIVSADLFKKIVSNLNGDVHLIFNEQSITFTEDHNEGLSKTFCLATKEVE